MMTRRRLRSLSIGGFALLADWLSVPALELLQPGAHAPGVGGEDDGGHHVGGDHEVPTADYNALGLHLRSLRGARPPGFVPARVLRRLPGAAARARPAAP